MNQIHHTSLDESSLRLWRTLRTPANILAASKKVKQKRRPKLRYPEMEKLLLSWIKSERTIGKAVSMLTIISKAKDLNVDPQFRASGGWFARFVKRSNLSRRMPTHVMQKIRDGCFEDVKKYLGEIRKRRFKLEIFHEIEHKSSYVFANMDEVPVYFDMTRGTTYHFKGEKNIRVVKTLGFKVRCSVVLSMLHDGRKLRPLVIFKSKGSSSKFAAMGSTRIVVRSNMNGIDYR